MMKIGLEQIKSGSKKRIGYLKGIPVYELATKGGLNLVLMSKNSVPLVLGLAPHRAIARHIAQRDYKDLILDELSKSEELPYDSYAHLVDFWAETTQKVNQEIIEG